MTDASNEQRESLFLKEIGIKDQKIKELLKNKRIRGILVAIIELISDPTVLDVSQKKLVYKVIEMGETIDKAQKYIDLILMKEIRTETDLKNAISVLKHAPEKTAEEIVVAMDTNKPSPEEVSKLALEVVRENATAPQSIIIKELKHHPRLEFVEPKELLKLLESIKITKDTTHTTAMEKGLTPEKIKTLLDMALQPQPPTRTINRMYQQIVVPEELLKSKERQWTRYIEGEMQTMHCPFTNYQKTPEILIKHIERTKGQVRVRFPPEPNGHLHIGHAKAMSINFGYKEFYNGWISLRYDDTNPKAEKTEYYDKIKEMVEWMGYQPTEITHASDYFQRLSECAVELIKRNKAYVCHMARKDVSEKKKEAMNAKIAPTTKEDQIISPWRDRPIEENLKEFEKMKRGEYDEGKAVLRMKMDMTSDNPQLWDLVAYRIIKHKHPRTGKTWVIYPSYDFTHCLTDSFEDITHSFCTTEFINARESYNWLCDALDLYRPVQWEYSRLNITDALLSKRFITKAITEGRFTGWDDPRLSTLEGLRSRGVPAQSIKRFVSSLGITRVSSEVPQHQLENILREDLSSSSKATAILNPLKLSTPETDILIDASDYREDTYDPSFYRLQKDSTVLLKEIGLVKQDPTKKHTLIPSTDTSTSTVPWLSTTAPTALLEIVQGETIYQFKNARISPEASKSPIGMYWQFIRLGYFIRMDTPDLFFRMVVPLKAAPLLESLTPDNK
ncbi:glutaminyl-tRNA synthetase [Nematocida sp. AWRm80]|nr:glutaminyl-tRNA synthetase [Nematocida sp. AWRm80]